MRDLRASAPILPIPEIGWVRAIFLALGDFVGLGIAWQIASKLNEAFQPLPREFTLWEFWGLPSLFWYFATVTFLILAAQGFYDSVSRSQNYVKQTQAISAIYLWSLVVNYFYDPKLDAPRSLFFAAWFASIFMVFAVRDAL